MLFEQLIFYFGFPAHVHIDRGSPFMRSDLKAYFAERGSVAIRSHHATTQAVVNVGDPISPYGTTKLLLHHHGWPEERC